MLNKFTKCKGRLCNSYLKLRVDWILSVHQSNSLYHFCARIYNRVIYKQRALGTHGQSWRSQVWSTSTTGSSHQFSSACPYYCKYQYDFLVFIFKGVKPFFTHINDWDGSGGGVLLCYICERLRYNSRMPNIYFKLGFVCAMCLHCIDMVIGQVGRDLTSLVEPPPPRFFWGGGGREN